MVGASSSSLLNNAAPQRYNRHDDDANETAPFMLDLEGNTVLFDDQDLSSSSSPNSRLRYGPGSKLGGSHYTPSTYRYLRIRPLVLLRKRFGRFSVLVISISSLFLVFIIVTFMSSFRSGDFPWYTSLPFFRQRVLHATFDLEGNLIRHPHYVVFSLPEPSSSTNDPSSSSTTTPSSDYDPYDPYDPTNDVSAPPRPAITDRPLRGVRRLPSHCVEEYFAYGSICRDGKPVKFDLVWTWVNGSDPRLEEAIAEAAKATKAAIEERAQAQAHAAPPPKDKVAKDAESKLYRDHDELRHSFRSVLTHFRPYIGRFHLFTSDFPFSPDKYTSRNFSSSTSSALASASASSASSASAYPLRSRPPAPAYDSTTSTSKKDTSSSPSSPTSPNYTHTIPSYIPNASNNKHLRLGQVPNWLSTDDEGKWRDGEVGLEVAYHSQVFEGWEGTSFNSFGIESQLPNLPHVMHNIIYLNDDFYFTKDLKPADFWTPSYGTVLRFDISFLLEAKRADDSANPGGEWGPLGTASWLLSNRFGARGRPYVKHAAKQFPLAILEETTRMWPSVMARTAKHRFRGMRDPDTGEYDGYITFLSSHLLVERFREALIWAWVVGRVGGEGGEWGEKERKRAWVELGGKWEGAEEGVVLEAEEEGESWAAMRAGGGKAEGVVEVLTTERATVKKDRVESVLVANGLEKSDRTSYVFSSLDGYPYGHKDHKGRGQAPKFDRSNTGEKLCTIEYEECFGKEGEVKSAAEAFKRMAFEKVECGDCLIHALRTNSGRLGLDAFLPGSQKRFPSSTLAPPPSSSSSAIQSWERTLESESSKIVDAQSSFSSASSAASSPPASLSPEPNSPSPLLNHIWSGLDPHLPFVSDWRDGDFSLKSVMKPWVDSMKNEMGDDNEGVNMRRWVVRLLERYQFVIGDTHVLFLMIENPRSARNLLRIRDYESLLCVNDDVKEKFKETDQIIRSWQAKRWPKPAQWERRP